MYMDPEEKLSAAAAACMLLCWQEPGDRALKGWAPYPGINPGLMTEEGLTRWLRDQVRATMAEVDDRARLHAV